MLQKLRKSIPIYRIYNSGGMILFPKLPTTKPRPPSSLLFRDLRLGCDDAAFRCILSSSLKFISRVGKTNLQVSFKFMFPIGGGSTIRHLGICLIEKKEWYTCAIENHENRNVSTVGHRNRFLFFNILGTTGLARGRYVLRHGCSLHASP